jgi:hypothetical protein
MKTIAQLINLVAGMSDADLTKVGVALLVATAGLIVVVLVARRYKMFALAKVASAPVLAIVIGTTVDGAVRFAQQGLHSHGIEAWFPAIVFEAVALNITAKAVEHARTYLNGPGVWGNRLYLVGTLAGAIVCTAGDNPGAMVFRFAMPIIGVWLVILNLTPDKADADDGESSWRWNLTNLLIYVGAKKPGKNSTEQVNREYQTKKIVSLGHKVHRKQSGGRLATALRDRRVARLARLALEADTAMEDDARAKIARAINIVDRLSPATEAATRQRQAEIEAATAATEAAKAEADHFRVAAQQAEAEAETLRQAVAGFRDQAATGNPAIRQPATPTGNRQPATGNEAATGNPATGNTDALSARLAQAEEAATDQAATNRQLTAELRELELRLAATGNGAPATNRQLVPLTTLPTGSALPVVERVAPATVARVLAARAANEAATQAELSAASGVSERTVRTVLAAIRQSGNRQPATGSPATYQAATGNRQHEPATGNGPATGNPAADRQPATTGNPATGNEAATGNPAIRQPATNGNSVTHLISQ